MGSASIHSRVGGDQEAHERSDDHPRPDARRTGHGLVPVPRVRTHPLITTAPAAAVEPPPRERPTTPPTVGEVTSTRRSPSGRGGAAGHERRRHASGQTQSSRRSRPNDRTEPRPAITRRPRPNGTFVWVSRCSCGRDRAGCRVERPAWSRGRLVGQRDHRAHERWAVAGRDRASIDGGLDFAGRVEVA